MVTLVLDEPARGLGFVGAGGPGDQVYIFVRAQLFGREVVEIALASRKLGRRGSRGARRVWRPTRKWRGR
jgi:hypothetical protein